MYLYTYCLQLTVFTLIKTTLMWEGGVCFKGCDHVIYGKSPKKSGKTGFSGYWVITTNHSSLIYLIMTPALLSAFLHSEKTST